MLKSIPKWSEMSLGQKAVYFVGLLVVLAILGPLAALAATAVTNLVTAGLMTAVLVALFVLARPFHRFLKSIALRLMKAEARMNPIETLQNDYLKKKASLESFIEFVTNMIAEHKLSQTELNDLKKQFPDRDLGDRQGMVDRMSSAVEILRAKALDAGDKLESYKDELDFIRADHKWASRFSGAMKQLKNVQGVDALDELLKDEAIGKVREDVAVAFAELDMLLAQDDTKEAMRIAHGRNPNILELTNVEIPEFEPART